MQLPEGERPLELRRDPFLRARVNSFATQTVEQDPPTTVWSTKSGLVCTATDVIKYIIQWPHHVI